MRTQHPNHDRGLKALVKASKENLGVALLVHWLFQSLLYMGWTERLFKLALDLCLTAVFAAFLRLVWSWPVAIMSGFLLAHTVNFLLNAQIGALAANYGLVHTSYEDLKAYAAGLGRRARREPAIDRTAICGSLTQESWHDESDLDVRVIRRPGFINGLRAAWFVLRERTRAHYLRFPLDIYLVDTESELRSKLRAREDFMYLSVSE